MLFRSLVAASGGHSSSRCAGPSLSRPLLLRSTSSSRAGSVVVAHGPSCSAACGILPDQGSNQCPLHWQADSQPLRHQGSPEANFLICLLQFVFHVSPYSGSCLSAAVMLPNACLCARCTVRPSNTKTSEFGAEKALLQGHARRRVAHALKSPELPESFQQSPFLGKVREGVVSCCKLLGVTSFVLEVRSRSGQDVPVNLHQNKCYSLF